MLEAAYRQCELDDCIKIVGLDSTITDKSKVVHSLVHITSTHPFTQSSVSYASATALDIIVANKGAEAKHKMAELLESSAGNPLTASLSLLNCWRKEQLVHGNKKLKPLFLCVSVVSPPSSSKMSVAKPAIIIPYFYATGALCGLAICVALYILVTILLTNVVVNQRIRRLMIIGLLCNILQQSIAIYVYNFNIILRLQNLIWLTILTYIGVQMYLSFEIYR